MDYGLIGTIARLINTTPNWDREVTRAVASARACAIAALIRALGAEVDYADLRGIELSQAKPDLPDRPLKATNAIVRDLASVKRIYDQEGHAIAPVSVDIESQDAVMAAARFLEWLGFADLELSKSAERDGVCLLGHRVVAQVDTCAEPADLRAVECLWLNTLHIDEPVAALFTLAGCAQDARVRAEQLLVAVFTLDPAGLPRPDNGAAEVLVRTGSTS